MAAGSSGFTIDRNNVGKPWTRRRQVVVKLSPGFEATFHLESKMDFLDQAISAHSQWKVKLLTAVNGGEVPDKAKCCVDNQCDLGKWIYGDGSKIYGTKPEFSVVREAHKKFHGTVGDVIDLVSQKKVAEAKKNILEGTFHLRSKEVVKAIMDLKSHVH